MTWVGHYLYPLWAAPGQGQG